MQASILANLARFPHCILLTRVGQFYESYFDQAPLVSQLLGLKLASRVFSKQRVPMCGFPIGYLHKHLRTLVVGNGRFVALCEEFPKSGSEFGAKVSFERRVVRVVTPGTLIDEPFLNPYENNYLLSITPGTTESNSGDADLPVGLAWIDVSTGEFFSRATTADALRNELVRLAPKEVVLPATFKDDSKNAITVALAEEGCFVSYAKPALDVDSDLEHIATVDAIPPDDLALATAETDPVSDTSTERSPHESSAITQLTSYLRANLLEHAPILSANAASASTPRMSIDAHTLKALEIREGMREGGTTGSVLSAIDRTRTRGGARLLTRWLCAPSASLPEIQARQALVALFRAPAREGLRTELTVLLREAGDAPRAVQRFALGRGGPGDIATLGSTLGAWNAIRRRIGLEREMEIQERGEAFDASEWASLDALMSRLDGVEALAEQVRLALPPAQDAEEEEMDTGDSDESSLDAELGNEMKYQTGSKWSINPEFSTELLQLHNEIEGLLDEKHEMELEFRQAYIAPSLTLRSSLGQGLHVHLARKRQAGHIKASPDFIPVSESGSTMSFFNPKWSRLGTRIMEASQSLMLAERQAFESLRQAVVNEEAALRRNARIVDELDVTLSFAHLAHEMNWVQPTITNDLSFSVVNGRHPTVELGLLTAGRMFTPNTVSFSPDSRLHVITGPNMAGKSTLLRQTALISILAQVGSFVPADSATIGIVDKLYSRVGAKDDLFRDRSTFMVEMLETAEILRRATPNSLVIMDEVGRGTTMKDGLAIAFATVHHLYAQNRCRALFATHFHELTDMLGYSPEHKGEGFFENIGFFCTDVDELQGGGFSYSHRLRPGVNRDSHGLKVAQLAGLPPEAVSVAREALSWLKDNSSDSTSQRDRLKTLGQSLADTSP
ncbi:hypothetical protein PENSPDRAFT_568815 [Peniophora sp. CONT]|nr:hypothetical protein PENSPDRAFT_568815 [Peniophora sp. CONT]